MNPELAALQECIQDLHQLMAVMSDPGATDVVAQCVKALTGLQKQMMQPQAGGPQAALAQRLTGGGGQQQPQGGGGGGGY